MSKTEVKDEARQSDGDPHVKGKIRCLRMQMHRNFMMKELPKATVVITNPTFIAIAVRYEQGVDPAPVVVAKGKRLIAERIRDVAKEQRHPHRGRQAPGAQPVRSGGARGGRFPRNSLPRWRKFWPTFTASRAPGRPEPLDLDRTLTGRQSGRAEPPKQTGLRIARSFGSRAPRPSRRMPQKPTIETRRSEPARGLLKMPDEGPTSDHRLFGPGTLIAKTDS